jgi:hypothetical protein
MDVYQFMSDSPRLTFFLTLTVLYSLMHGYRLTMRALNIRKHGWPPAHCDADGDQVESDNAGN